MNCCEEKYITIYRNFPTKWNGRSLIDVSFDTPLDLTGFSAIFKIGETQKTYTDIAEGFSIDLTKEETATLPVGLNYGELIVVDNETHKRPFTTALPFNVLTFVEGDIHLDNYNVNVTTKINGVDLTINIETPTATLDPDEIERYISEHNLDEESHPYILGELDKKVDKVSTANRVYGTDENGDQTTYDANSFGQVDDVRVGGVSVVQNKIASLGTMAGESASDYRTASDQDTIDGGLSDRITANTNKFSDYRTASSQDVIDSGLSDRITSNTNRFDNYRTASDQDSIDNELSGRIDDIEEVIPEQASSQNQLADKNFVNSSISTNTANFIGTFNSVQDLENYSGTLTNNDYAFVIGQDSEGNTVYNRYKYTDATTPASWIFEYALNNSSFTANQWAAINSGATPENIAQIATNTTAIQTINNSAVMNSGITSAKVSQYDGYATSKQNTINDLETIRAGASAGSTAVQPSAIANMQTTDNMVQSVRASSSAETTKYPSEKAVASKVDGLQDAIEQEVADRFSMDNQLHGRIDDVEDYVSESLNSFVKTTDTIPITNYDLLDVPVQYRGATNQNYINGYFYRFTDPVYSSTVTVQTGSFTVTIDNAKFISWFLKTGRHWFRKQDSGYWYNSTIGEVHNNNLIYYGITINGTSNVNDVFYVDFTMDTTITRIDVQPAGGAVNSVNGQTGTVVLDAEDVGALPDSTEIPTDTADLTNGAGFITLSSLSGTSPIAYNNSTGAISVASGYQIPTTTQVSQIGTNTSDISTINGKIPSQASTTNQLADKSFVNSSISTNTANFIGTFNSIADLEAYSGTLTNNDYAFVVGTDQQGNTIYNRYKYTTATSPAEWVFEYALNNSSFTANQWASINSGATSINIALAESALQSGDDISELNNDAGYITTSALSGYATQVWVGQQGFLTSTALSGYATEQWVGQQGYITGITSSDVTTALGYTPYNSTNPAGYITSSALSGYLQNTGSHVNSLAIGKSNLSTWTGDIIITTADSTFSGASCGGAIIVGRNSSHTNNSYSSLGLGDSCSVAGKYAIALGGNSHASANYAIQLGYGTNSTANTMNVGLSTSLNVQLLDSSGKIPDGRLPIASSVSSSSTNAEVVGAKLFYDTVGGGNYILTVPDYTQPTELAVGQLHTMTSNGWIFSSGSVRLGSNVGLQICAGGAYTCAPVENGQTVYISGTVAKFYPCKV